MNTHKKTQPDVVQALGLTSGGLDSTLSALLLRDQGVRVAWVHFETPFFSADRAKLAARTTGIPLTIKNITDVYIEMLKHPRCGYGANMNPCLDCHALMLEIAGSMMNTKGFDFLFTGEVLGQRPMSQTRPSLRCVEKRSGMTGQILRPFSAKLLPLTVPEERGLVDRERLLDISGRSRKRQMALADAFGVTDYPTPSGGCLLTDPGFSRRVKDLLAHQADCNERDFALLKYGRHFRLYQKFKVIAGRNQEDNIQMSKLVDYHKEIELRMMDMAGPTVLVSFGAPSEIVHEAAALCAAYSKADNSRPVRVSVKDAYGIQAISVLAGSSEKYQGYLI